MHKFEDEDDDFDFGEVCVSVCVRFLQDWRAKAGRCVGGRPWSRWRLMSGDFVSSNYCRVAVGRDCEVAVTGEER